MSRVFAQLARIHYVAQDDNAARDPAQGDEEAQDPAETAGVSRAQRNRRPTALLFSDHTASARRTMPGPH